MPPHPMGRPRGGSVTKNSKKNSLPAVPQRDLEAGVLRREDDFHESGVNQIDSCLFLQSSNLGRHRSWTFLHFYIKTQNYHKDVKGQRKYYHDQKTNLNLTRMIRFFLLTVSCREIPCRMKKQRVCLAISLYSLLNFFVFLL